MMKRVLIGSMILLSVLCVQEISAQTWSRQDSIRLANILAGKDTLRLNPEFQRAIKNGTLIHSAPVGKMQAAHSKLPLACDFSAYVQPDRRYLSDAVHSTFKNQPPVEDLTPQAAMHLPAEMVMTDRIRVNPKVFTIDPRIIEEAKVKRSLATFDANYLLSYMLSPSYRQKLKNSQRETYKIYTQLPTPEIRKKQHLFREQHPELVLASDTLPKSLRYGSLE